jgi:hypothetical protein
MFIKLAGAAALVAVWASPTSAQPWRSAYDRQDYPTAAALLQGEVFEHPGHGAGRYPDSHAVQKLAELYAEGRGVPQDGVTACALANLASGAAVYHYGEKDPRTAAIGRQVDAYCVPLSVADRREAMDANRCLAQGPSPRVLVESGMRRVELTRSTLRVSERGRERDYPLAPLARCAQQLTDVRYARVSAPKGSRAAAREFVEVYAWHSTMNAGRRYRMLEWTAVELTPRAAIIRARTLLTRAEGSAWPANPLPAEFTKPVKFSMQASGDVRWQMTGKTGLHGVIGRPAPLRAAARVR